MALCIWFLFRTSWSKYFKCIIQSNCDLEVPLQICICIVYIRGIPSIKTWEKLKLFIDLAFLTMYTCILFHYPNSINNVRISFKSNFSKYDCSHTYPSLILLAVTAGKNIIPLICNCLLTIFCLCYFSSKNTFWSVWERFLLWSTEIWGHRSL